MFFCIKTNTCPRIGPEVTPGLLGVFITHRNPIWSLPGASAQHHLKTYIITSLQKAISKCAIFLKGCLFSSKGCLFFLGQCMFFYSPYRGCYVFGFLPISAFPRCADGSISSSDHRTTEYEPNINQQSNKTKIGRNCLT